MGKILFFKKLHSYQQVLDVHLVKVWTAVQEALPIHHFNLAMFKPIVVVKEVTLF